VSNNETSNEQFQTWMCLICGWIYDEAAGLPDEGIAPGTRWADVPMNWTCPECGARKEDFEMVAIEFVLDPLKSDVMTLVSLLKNDASYVNR
jgi:rubredoxin